MAIIKRFDRAFTIVGSLFLFTSVGCEGLASSSRNLPAEQTASPTPNESTGNGDLAKPDSEPPPESTIKAKLEKNMWGPPAQGGSIHTYQYKSLKIAPARVGDSWTDGVPANLRTNVNAVNVVVDVTRTFTDGSSKQESKDQTYVFFKDEFGDWTYRFIQNNSKGETFWGQTGQTQSLTSSGMPPSLSRGIVTFLSRKMVNTPGLKPAA